MKMVLLLIAALIIGVMPLCAQPTINQQPANQVLAIGGTLILAVTANGSAPLAYQWYKDDRLLLEATNSDLTVADAGMTNSGSYFVVVTNGDGMVISLPALVAVGSPTLVAWGYNVSGALVNGTTNNSLLPISVVNNVVTAAGGFSDTLFVTTDGTLWTVGGGSFGQLGNGTNIWTDVMVTNIASDVVAVAAGNATSFFITSDGTLWGMGANTAGQLGIGTTSNTNLPVMIASNVVTAAVGVTHMLFVKTDGTLWAAGQNWYGDLGLGTNVGIQTTPAWVASNVVMAAAGQFHSLFVTTDGTLWGMGFNGDGELGLGATTNVALPVILASNVTAVAAGQFHSLFMTTDGTLWGMGYNGYGQLGNGTSTDATQPIKMASNVTEMAAGEYHSLFVTAGGTVWATGYNAYGQLGNGTVNTAYSAIKVHDFFACANICPVGEGSFSLALGISSNATVTLSNLVQNYTGSPLPVTANTVPSGLNVNLFYNGIPFPPKNPGSYKVIGVISDPVFSGGATNTMVITYGLPYSPPTITAGPVSQASPVGGSFTLNVTASGTTPLACQWFKNFRELPGATNTTLTVTSASIFNSGIYSVVASNGFGTAISIPVPVAVGNPSLLAWGNNTYGQLGNGTTSSTAWPIIITNGVVTAAAGMNQSLFVTTNGRLWTIGGNGYGQLGDGKQTNTNRPTLVASNVVAVAGGYGDSFYVTTNGTLWAMGLNENGELGDGVVGANSNAVRVTGGVVAVAAGLFHSLFITTNGVLWAMGGNQYGQFGNGTTSVSNGIPVSVASDVVAVAAGENHTLFVRTDGTLWAAGENQYGQLGNGTTNIAVLPVNVASNVVAVTAGTFHSVFMTADGTLWAMGDNREGQLGDGTTNNALLPEIIASNVVAIAAGAAHSLFITTNGTPWATGDNLDGELGNGTNGNYSTGPINLSYLSVANVFAGEQGVFSLAIGAADMMNGINLSGGIPAMTFFGAPGAGYNIERSTDLINWIIIGTTNAPNNGVFQFTDPSAPMPNAYYQIHPFP